MFPKNRHSVSNYKDIHDAFANCRDKIKGKPLAKWGRITKDGDAYVISCHGMKFLRVTPDNVAEFLITPQEGANISVTLSGSMNYTLPFMWYRVGTCRYRVVHQIEYMAMRNQGRDGLWARLTKETPELFKGIKFSLVTGECLNRRPDLLSLVNKDRRAVWLKKIRTFKRGMRVRIKMGVFDSVFDNMIKENVDFHRLQRVDWSEDKWLDELYKAIDTEQYPTELIRLLVIESTPRWRPIKPTADQHFATLDAIFNRTSVSLRSRFGVFDSIQGETA